MNNFSNQNENTIALLIDGDHIDSKYIDVIEKELAIIGNTTYKRLYYTYNKGMPHHWNDVCNAHALNLRQVMPYANVKKDNVKNVADSVLIIDAMDILYSGNVNCVCIVASDSDYTNIAKRLKESNIRVLGMGENQTPIAFVNACDEFKYLENLIERYETATTEKPAAATANAQAAAESSIPGKGEIENFITNLLIDEGTKMDAGKIKLRIRRNWPNFDETNYNVSRMSDFFDQKKFKVIHEDGGNVNIDLLNR